MRRTIIGHRGLSSMAPENTLSAFRMADKMNVPWVECDAEVLGDGTVVIFHDSVLDRCTDQTGQLANLTKADLNTIDAGSWFSKEFIHERIPTIEDFFSLINNSRLCVNLEIKSFSHKKSTTMLLDGVIQAIRQYWQKDRPLIVSSFNHAVLADFKQRMPDVTVACLFKGHIMNQDWLSIMKEVDAQFAHPADNRLTEAMITTIKKQGYGINVWTVNNIIRAEELFSWGVDGICTDIPHQFNKAYLKHQYPII